LKVNTLIAVAIDAGVAAVEAKISLDALPFSCFHFDSLEHTLVKQFLVLTLAEYSGRFH